MPVNQDSFQTLTLLIKIMVIQEKGKELVLENNVIEGVLGPWVNEHLDKAVRPNRMRAVILGGHFHTRDRHKLINTSLSEIIQSTDSQVIDRLKLSLSAILDSLTEHAKVL